MLHPIGAGPAGHNQARREAIEVWQERAVHLVGDERRLVIRLPHWEALDEGGGLVIGGAVGAVECNLNRLFLQSDLSSTSLSRAPFQRAQPMAP